MWGKWPDRSRIGLEWDGLPAVGSSAGGDDTGWGEGDGDGDCDCCDKALFRRGSFPRNTLESKRNYPPFYIVYADGFGGQKSFGKKSIDGASRTSRG